MLRIAICDDMPNELAILKAMTDGNLRKLEEQT